eukprot:TRINITY_DN4754_c0_g2_i1.p1 TRINITY_DN4754_c0_g2~~TRINITY_DN4754_c0_g2_i1.p1  ORF type:complete len:173 (-),score=17.63 TRINITY_DN4754_c0_g2_i1:133-651(-)
MMFKRMEDILVRDLVHHFSGTPLAQHLWRLLGAQVGVHCYLHGSWATEFDMVSIGDNVCVVYTDLQSHLFEDRVFKCNPIQLGDHVTVMAFTLLLPCTTIEAGAVIGPKSCVMQGETVPSNTHWQGAPLALVPKQEIPVRSTWRRHTRSMMEIGETRGKEALDLDESVDLSS